ncbi:hypothetical protein GCM10017786_33100 [Amycolatopsis deserti]|uniref:Uncharacterized protein n=1 Tax=Amycolatopsis deserti TaxID=185696 RepID=A0ABQ3J0Y4_9PSEU|nr:hypothetical protein [Amycolatopsis deserti]GHE97700.1 hypothetical protein GCM10017786_33100 [Amycolatopsis deserti]
MTEQTLPGRRNRNQATRLALAEARQRGLARRHLRKLMRLAHDQPCRCGEVHRHVCSYPDVVRALDST